MTSIIICVKLCYEHFSSQSLPEERLCFVLAQCSQVEQPQGKRADCHWQSGLLAPDAALVPVQPAPLMHRQKLNRVLYEICKRFLCCLQHMTCRFGAVHTGQLKPNKQIFRLLQNCNMNNQKVSHVKSEPVHALLAPWRKTSKQGMGNHQSLCYI